MGRPRIRPRTEPSSLDAIGIRDRAQRLIARYYEGNARKAAAAMRVPQPTLWRLLEGGAARLEVLSALARCCEVDVGWLIEEKGNGPAEPSRGSFAELMASPSGEAVRWRTALRELEPHGLAADGALSWSDWPAREPLFAAHHFFDFNLADEHPNSTPEQRALLARALDEWRDGCFAGAADWLERMIRVFGPEKVGPQLELLRGYAMHGFHAQNAIRRALETSNDPIAAEMLAATKASLRLPHVPPLVNRSPLRRRSIALAGLRDDRVRIPKRGSPGAAARLSARRSR